MRLAVLLAAAALLNAGQAKAQEIFRLTIPLSSGDLAKVRAGFVDADGVEFSFGVLTQTYLNGQLSLASQLSVDSPTDVTRRVSSDPRAIANGGAASLSEPGDGGVTTLLQVISPSQIANVVTTSANNQVIRQNTAVSLTLQGFEQNQATYALEHAISSLNMIVGLSALTRR